MPKISRIVAREILDSRATPTVEASVMLDSGHFGTASVPSGASTGKTEAVELRDNDPARYHGKGVQKAVSNIVNHIAPGLIGMDASNQEALDKKMGDLDGTGNKAKLGANAMLAVSVACLKAAASAARMPLFAYIAARYRPGAALAIPGVEFNLINGGKHGAGNLDFQEFHVIPSTRFSFSQTLQAGTEIFEDLKQELIHRNAVHSVGDEGGFAPNLFTNSDALELLALVIKNSPYRLGSDVFLALDVAADVFYKDGKYQIKDSPRPLDVDGMIALYQGLVKDYGLLAIEDGLDQEDFRGWSKMRQALPATVTLVADDLVTTNIKRLERAIEEKSCTGVIVKPNQIGTVSETVQFMMTAAADHVSTICSHRSGETNDPFIADFAVGMGANYVKFGAPDRGERVAKYNRLLEIETYLAAKAG